MLSGEFTPFHCVERAVVFHFLENKQDDLADKLLEIREVLTGLSRLMVGAWWSWWNITQGHKVNIISICVCLQ